MQVDYQKEIVESPKELSKLEKTLRAKRTWPRVRMLWLLKSGKVSSVVKCSILLGYDWNQLQRWWKTYKTSGLEGLLEIHSPPGRPPRITGEAIKNLKDKMQQGKIATLAQARDYLKERWQIEYKTESGVWRMFKRAKIKKKTGRRKHPDADLDEQEDFKKNFDRKIGGVERIFAVDEARFGLITWFRRRWCPSGIRPPWIGQIRQEFIWLYAAVEPVTGESFFLFLPALDQACFELFLNQLKARVGDQTIGVILDRAPAHRSQNINRPQGLVSIELPAYSPELNPAERVFEQLRENMANQLFAGVSELEQSITDQLQSFWDNPQKLVSLTAYPWWIKAVKRKRAFSIIKKIFWFFKELGKHAMPKLSPDMKLQLD
jgi:transposase